MDNLIINYCHSLTEGSYSDWRLSTLSDLIQVNANMTVGGNSYLQGLGNFYLHTSSRGLSGGGNQFTVIYNIVTSLQSDQFYSSGFKFYCVRGNRSMIDHLSLTSSPAKIKMNSPRISEISPFVIQIRDSLNNPANTQGAVITASATGASVVGTATATTDANGVATFSNLSLDTAGTIVVTFSTPGLTSVTASVVVRNGPEENICIVDDGIFTTAAGGCRLNGTGQSWSLRSAVPMSFFDAVWEYTAGTQNVGDPPRASDGARTTDCDPAKASNAFCVDSSVLNYCHQLNEGGYTDWRLPVLSELNAVYLAANGMYTHLIGVGSNFIWSSQPQATGGGSSNNAYSLRFSDQYLNAFPKTTLLYVSCIRP